MQTAKKLLTWDTRLNIRALADEGFELAECKGNYFLKYGKEFIDLGNLKQTAKQFTSLFDKKNSTKAKKALEEWIERIRLRREALAEFSQKLGKEVVDDLSKHLKGVVEKKPKLGADGKPKLDKFGKQTYRTVGSGGHSYQAVLDKLIEIVGATIPPNPALDEPFIAFVKFFDKANPKSFVWKNNSTLRVNGKMVREATSMFPKNWNEQRIMEEVAFAWKNMIKVGQVTRDNGVIVETYLGKTTSGFEVEFIYNNGVLISTPPKVNF